MSKKEETYDMLNNINADQLQPPPTTKLTPSLLSLQLRGSQPAGVYPSSIFDGKHSAALSDGQFVQHENILQI